MQFQAFLYSDMMGAKPHANWWERNCFLIIIPWPFPIFLINKAKQNLHTLQITFAAPAPDWNVFVYAEKSCVNGGGQWGERMCVSEACPEQAAAPLVSELCFLGMWNRLESHHSIPREQSWIPDPPFHSTLNDSILEWVCSSVFSFISAARLHIIIIFLSSSESLLK